MGISKKRSIPTKKRVQRGFKKKGFKKKKALKNQQKEKDQSPYKEALFKNYR
ncbi:hypothetical protein HpCK2_14330 [Helicobacter pylori]